MDILQLVEINSISKLPTYILVKIANQITSEVNAFLMLDQYIEQRGPTLSEILDLEFYQMLDEETAGE